MTNTGVGARWEGPEAPAGLRRGFFPLLGECLGRGSLCRGGISAGGRGFMTCRCFILQMGIGLEMGGRNRVAV